jgi:cobalt/nickel transport protein
MLKRNLLLLLAVVILAVGPLLLHGRDGAEFTGSDDQAEAMITQIKPDYQPWAAPIWEPPSGEIESLLFALQAAIGAGLLGYYFGRRRAQSEAKGGLAPNARPDAVP